MTFNELQLDVNRRLNFADTPAAAVTNRLNTFLNTRHRQLLAMPGLRQLRDDTITFASVATTQRYALPQSLARVNTIWETTNLNKLEERSLQWLHTIDPKPSAGTPYVWIPMGTVSVATQPAAATGLWVVSTSASDGAGTTAYLEGVRTGGYRRSANVALNGTTRAALDSANVDYIEIDKWYLSAAAVGAVSLYDAATAGNELARIPIGQTFARYVAILLWPTPSAAITYQVDYTRQIFDMSVANDEPLLPPDFHYLLSVGARLDEYEKRNDGRRLALAQEWQEGIRALKAFVMNHPDYVVVPGMTGGLVHGRSNLGPWYPRSSNW